MPESGDLKDYLRITEHGRNYLAKIENSNSDKINYSLLPNHNGTEDTTDGNNL